MLCFIQLFITIVILLLFLIIIIKKKIANWYFICASETISPLVADFSKLECFLKKRDNESNLMGIFYFFFVSLFFFFVYLYLFLPSTLLA